MSHEPSASDVNPVLQKRKDFIHTDEAAKAHPNRTLYLRRNTNFNAIIDACSKKLILEGLTSRSRRCQPISFGFCIICCIVKPFFRTGGDLEALRTRADALRMTRDFGAAASDYTALLGWNANDIKSLYQRGSTFERMGEYDKAVQDFSELLRLAPDHIPALYSRAVAYNQKSEFALAIRDYEVALAKEEELFASSHSRKSGSISAEGFQGGIDEYTRQYMSPQILIQTFFFFFFVLSLFSLTSFRQCLF